MQVPKSLLSYDLLRFERVVYRAKSKLEGNMTQLQCGGGALIPLMKKYVVIGVKICADQWQA